MQPSSRSSPTHSRVRTRIKICGITHPEHARAAADAGADAIGLVFYPDSPRSLTTAQARDIAAATPAFVARVALFLDAASDTVAEVVAAVRPDMLQFHGSEPPDFCRAFGLPYMRAVPMGEGANPEDFAAQFPDARALLLDSHRPGEPGGRGTAFDWTGQRLGAGSPELVLAGGLTPDNVAAAIRNMRPYGVDVSSGVESTPGHKDPQRMRAFIEAVYSADRE